MFFVCLWGKMTNTSNGEVWATQYLINMTIKKRRCFGTKKKTDLTVFEESSINSYKDRFSKWHNRQIDLLTFCINLNFTLSIAMTGFIISNQDKLKFKDQLICGEFSIVKTLLCLFATAATLGVLALISRINDFRLTKNIIKKRRRIFELNNDIRYEDTKQSNKYNLITLRDSSICWAKFLGNMTWVLFYAQLVALLVAIWTMVINA